MKHSSRRDFAVGLFVLAGIAAIAYLSISIGGLRWRRSASMKLSAAFDETAGLAVGAPVVVAGVRVGQVSTLSLADDFRGHVELELDSDLKLPTDSSAAIVTAGVLGDRYIEIAPGIEDKTFKDGDAFSHTESAVVLERLISQFIYGSTKNKAGDTASPGATPGAAPNTPTTSPFKPL